MSGYLEWVDIVDESVPLMNRPLWLNYIIHLRVPLLILERFYGSESPHPLFRLVFMGCVLWYNFFRVITCFTLLRVDAILPSADHLKKDEWSPRSGNNTNPTLLESLLKMRSNQGDVCCSYGWRVSYLYLTGCCGMTDFAVDSWLGWNHHHSDRGITP